jgi:hypothetical protein
MLLACFLVNSSTFSVGMSEPFFSIIIPALNSALTIQRCLSSLRVQICQDFEVILADGGSIDPTVKIAQSCLGEQLIISSEPDRGLFAGVSRGVSLSRGKWLLILGSDDELFCRHSLSQAYYLLSTLASGCRSAAYGNAFIRGNTGWSFDGETYMGPIDLPLLMVRNLCQQAIFYRGCTLRNPELQFNHYLGGNGGDHPCHVRLWCLQPYIYLPMTVSIFHAGGTSSFRPTQYTPRDVLTTSFWPRQHFSRIQSRWQRWRCLVAWKQPRLYRVLARIGSILSRLKRD